MKIKLLWSHMVNFKIEISILFWHRLEHNKRFRFGLGERTSKFNFFPNFRHCWFFFWKHDRFSYFGDCDLYVLSGKIWQCHIKFSQTIWDAHRYSTGSTLIATSSTSRDNLTQTPQQQSSSKRQLFEQNWLPTCHNINSNWLKKKCFLVTSMRYNDFLCMSSNKLEK